MADEIIDRPWAVQFERGKQARPRAKWDACVRGLLFLTNHVDLSTEHSRLAFLGDSSTKGYALSITSATLPELHRAT